MESSTAGIGLLIGAALPLLISIINRSSWSPRVQSVVALVLCFIGAAVSTLFVDGIDLSDPGLDLVAYFGTVYGAAMVMYSRFWKPTGVAPTIEKNT